MTSEDPVREIFSIPHGACDCHTHVFPDRARYPFVKERKYTPPPASCEDLRLLLDELGLERVVIVQPSVYGADNSATLAGIAELGRARARAVAVIQEDTPQDEMERLALAGVRGIRINFELSGEANHERAARHLETMAEKIAPFLWHIQIYAQLPLIAAFIDTLRTIPVPVVFDHFAGAQGPGGLDQPGLAGVIGLLREGRAYVKLSAAYRQSRQLPFADLTPIATAFIEANPDRILWGSDWPHPDPHRGPGSSHEDVSPPLAVNDREVFTLLGQWAKTQSVYDKILRDNPARLYDF
ncbi:putative TIM-barrel fold metal-dependent hydrolase [Rhodoligotrophos appendicifer]|uniref:amidohydrolase family protein n=1 Tax=Rhodoligotrophos appendicifer TaxID=987056 RepID=UPI001184840B|nr:amidohydrolase family protein [Rhodoligotrophos appendicifer]